MTTTKRRERSLAEWLDLFPGRDAALAKACRVTRETIRLLRRQHHAKIPLDLLGAVARSMLRHGLVDGSRPPDRPALVRAWMAANTADRNGP